MQLNIEVQYFLVEYINILSLRCNI